MFSPETRKGKETNLLQIEQHLDLIFTTASNRSSPICWKWTLPTSATPYSACHEDLLT